jgi:hypothetical protein
MILKGSTTYQQMKQIIEESKVIHGGKYQQQAGALDFKEIVAANELVAAASAAAAAPNFASIHFTPGSLVVSDLSVGAREPFQETEGMKRDQADEEAPKPQDPIQV